MTVKRGVRCEVKIAQSAQRAHQHGCSQRVHYSCTTAQPHSTARGILSHPVSHGSAFVSPLDVVLTAAQRTAPHCQISPILQPFSPFSASTSHQQPPAHCTNDVPATRRTARRTPAHHSHQQSVTSSCLWKCIRFTFFVLLLSYYFNQLLFAPEDC